MTPTRIGIDTSVLVRLITQDPEELFRRCVNELRLLRDERRVTVYASNQVIREAYATLRYHYRASRDDAKIGLIRAFDSGLVAPLNGQAVIEALAASGGPGLFDRLITDDYSRAGLETLTLDRRMASLPNARRL